MQVLVELWKGRAQGGRPFKKDLSRDGEEFGLIGGRVLAKSRGYTPFDLSAMPLEAVGEDFAPSIPSRNTRPGARRAWFGVEMRQVGIAVR